MVENRIGLQIITVAVIFLLAGCATSSSAPFHMYSSPLLEAEMSPPHPKVPAAANDRGSAPGVAPRQVYTYNRWRDSTVPSSPNRKLRPGGPGRPIYDTVETSNQPVLANYNPRVATGAGRTLGGASSAGASVDSTADRGEIEDETADEPGQAAQYVHAVLLANEVALEPSAATSVTELYRSCRSQGEVYHSNRPNIGDLVFFHNTQDANQDGRNNDWYTLVGIIEGVDPDGTVNLLAYRRNRVRRHQINLDEVDRHSNASGRILNTKLRVARDDDAPFTQYLAGQLFAGFCNILGERQELVVIDHWTPETELESSQRP